MVDRHLLFENISKKYDLLNNVISLGLHKFLKKKAIKKLTINDNQSVIDLCTGTGDIAEMLYEINPTLKITGADFSSKMLDIAQKRLPDIKFVEADCTNLPFDDNSFDICTMFFGFRNVEDKQACITEIRRVLKTNGQLLHFDFGKTNFIFSKILDLIILISAQILSKDKAAYEYLIKTKQEFMSPKKIISAFGKYGFKNTKRVDYLFGIISAQYFVLNSKNN